MSIEEQSLWRVTDPDCLQCCRMASEIATNVYELVQVNRFGPEISGQEFFQVVHDHIRLDDYDKEEELRILAEYGYDPLESHSDGLEYLSDEGFNQHLAEMYFEDKSLSLSYHECSTWNQAVDYIQKLTGMDLSAYRKAEKEQPSQTTQVPGSKPRLNDLIADAQSRTPGRSETESFVPERGR